MFWRSARLVCACSVLAFSASPACGGNASDPGVGTAGSAGSPAQSASGSGGSIARAGSPGAAAQPTAIECGSKSCTGLLIPIRDFVVPPCCSNETTGQCGLDSSALSSFGPTLSESCQPLAQPGTKDATCPDSPMTAAQGLAISFPGCCRPNHSCGYQLDSVAGLFPLGLGCVDAAPFLEGSAPQTCGEAGAAGAPGDHAGAGGDSSGAGGDNSGAGGDNSGAGAGGDSGSAGFGGG
jgi:hypothetical protein